MNVKTEPPPERAVAMTGNAVGGRPTSPSDLPTQIVDPATGTRPGPAPLPGAAEVGAAVSAARTGCSARADTPPSRRTRLVNRRVASMDRDKNAHVSVGDVGDEIVVGMAARAPHVERGTVLDVETGPVAVAAARTRIAGCVMKGVAREATLVADGRGFQVSGREAASTMSAYRDEIFGPVLACVGAAKSDEASRLVKAHEFGDDESPFDGDRHAARRFGRRIQVRTVGVNLPTAWHGSGRWKRSRFGDSHASSEEGVRSTASRSGSCSGGWTASARERASPCL